MPAIQMSVTQLSSTQLSVAQMSIGQMSVGQMSVGQMAFYQKTQNLIRYMIQHLFDPSDQTHNSFSPLIYSFTLNDIYNLVQGILKGEVSLYR